MKECGKMKNKMELELKIGLIILYTKESLKMGKKKVLENIFFLMVKFILVNGIITT